MSWFFTVLTTFMGKCAKSYRRWYAAVQSEPLVHHTAEWWSHYYQRTVGTFILTIWLIVTATVVLQEFAVGIKTWSNASPSCCYAFAVEINVVSWPELTCLPGIGEVLGKRIVDTRSKVGHFSRREDLLVVRGIGPKTLEKIGPYLRFSSGSEVGRSESSNRTFSHN